MIQQEWDHISNHPTSGTSGFIKSMVDGIVHNKIQELTNQMGTFYQSLYEEEPINDKTVLTKSLHQQVLISSPRKALNKYYRKDFKKTAETTINHL